ncbi:NB-ARC domain-containing protein [Sulfitobacter sp. AS59]|uniref:NB-ARC domain-containing protein n=1 Tax=Sulfitobacter sp. AS59 TaxID=3135784 RepID=UPI0031788AFE
MASYQRIALFIFFDAIERDLVRHIRSISSQVDDHLLTEQEREKTILRSANSTDEPTENADDFDLLNYLDLGDKIAIVQRFRSKLDDSLRSHFSSKRQILEKCVPIRNSLMHGRPLTVNEHAVSFALANDLVKNKAYWPNLERQLTEYNNDPDSVTRKSVSYLDDVSDVSIFHNLPLPDYDDTGFVPRPKLEQELRKKILGRHPVVTVLGDGGNGKTALALQSLYGLINSGDHEFEAIVWVSAKSSKLTVGEIQRVEQAIVNSLGLFDKIGEVFGDTGKDPLYIVRQLLENNRILLVIDNLETVLDKTITDFVADIPGDSKIVFTSRVPVTGGLTVSVGTLSEAESTTYLRALIKAYGIEALSKVNNDEIKFFARKLDYKPLLLKWFCLGVSSGLTPTKILANPEIALRYCLENVFDVLGKNARLTLSIIISLPRAVSLGVLQYVSDIEVTKLESGLAELLKFTIVDTENFDGLEVNYKIRPFARSYVSRILKETPVNKNDIISRFRGLSSVYQTEKGAGGKSWYNPRHYTVRSISEALAVQQLRNVLRLSSGNDLQGALEALEAIKIAHSDYFEVYRVEAFVKIRHNDLSGANDSYVTAIELAPEIPQIHYFYGGFFLRSYNDCKSAIVHLSEACRIDPDSIEVKRELARAKMFDFNFSGAEELLSGELDKHFSNLKSKLIFSDLRTQNFQKMISHFAQNGIEADLIKPMEQFLGFLETIDSAIVDETMLQHLQKAHFEVCRLTINTKLGEPLIKKLNELIETAAAKVVNDTVDGPDITIRGVKGSLKEQGRKPNFGFLVESSGRETFVPRAAVNDLVWQDLCLGGIAKYDIQTDDTGRSKAVNVTISTFAPLTS